MCTVVKKVSHNVQVLAAKGRWRRESWLGQLGYMGGRVVVLTPTLYILYFLHLFFNNNKRKHIGIGARVEENVILNARYFYFNHGFSEMGKNIEM